MGDNELAVPFVFLVAIALCLLLIWMLLPADKREPLHPSRGLTPVVGEIFSLHQTPKIPELVEFVAKSKEVERLLQRYQYYVERIRALKLGSHALDHDQQRRHDDAKAELAILPQEVYNWVQALVDYTIEKRKNSWVRWYLSNSEERHHNSGRHERAMRLGCCAASCGCCNTPGRRKLPEADIDDAPNGLLMRMASERYLPFAHCSDDCGCCIRRRGFRVSSDEASTESYMNAWSDKASIDTYRSDSSDATSTNTYRSGASDAKSA